MRWAALFGAGIFVGLTLGLLADRNHVSDGHTHCVSCGRRIDRPFAKVIKLVPQEA